MKAFISYTRGKDEFNSVSLLKKRLVTELNLLLPGSTVFQDKQMTPGELFKGRLSDELAMSDALLILVSPAWLASAPCRWEYENFCATKEQQDRTPIIVPLLWTTTPQMSFSSTDSIARALAMIQCDDWREIRHDKWEESNALNRRVAKLAEVLSIRIGNALDHDFRISAEDNSGLDAAFSNPHAASIEALRLLSTSQPQPETPPLSVESTPAADETHVSSELRLLALQREHASHPERPKPAPPAALRGRSTQTNPVGPWGYVSLTGLGLLASMAMLVLLIRYSPSLAADGTLDRIFYLMLVVLGLSAGAFFFGAMRSYATFIGKVLNGTLELGGPLVVAVLVIVGGFVLAPSASTFDITVRVNDERGMPITDGNLVLYVGTDTRTAPVNANGEADFKEIPGKFRQTTSRLRLASNEYRLAEPLAEYRLNQAMIRVIAAKTATDQSSVQERKVPPALPQAVLPVNKPSGVSARLSKQSNNAEKFTQMDSSARPPIRSTSTDETQPSRHSEKIRLEVQIAWDQGEGATPGMQLPREFTCGQWSLLSPIDGQPDYVSKRRLCTAKVTTSGSAKLILNASLGKVWVAYVYQVGDRLPMPVPLGWVKKGAKKEEVIAWELQ